MPYVDEGETPKKSPGLPVWTPYLAGAAAAGVAFLLWGLLYTHSKGSPWNLWLAPILGGLLIGGAMRVTGKHLIPRVGMLAASLTAVSGLVGYVYRHVALRPWVTNNGQQMKVDINNAIYWLLNRDLTSVILIAFGAYIAYALATMYPPGSHAPPPEDPPA